MRLNRIAIRILILCSICISPCCRTGENDNMRNVNSYEHNKYGRIRVVFLAKSGTIQSWPCRHGKIRFYDDGKLLSCTLQEDHEMKGDLIPGRIDITFYRNGNPESVRLTEDTEIQGQRAARNRHFSDLLTLFHGDGSLKRFSPQGNTEIDGIQCSDRTGIELYPDGQLMVCQLQEDYSMGDKSFPAGTKLVIDENRNVYEYTEEIYLSIQNHFDLGKYINEKLLQVYDARMHGRIDQAYTAAQDLVWHGGFNPMGRYEMGRIRRQKMLGGDPAESFESILGDAGTAAAMDRYNVILRFFEADCASFAGYRNMMKGDSIPARRYYLRALDALEAVLRMKPDCHAARLNLVDLYTGLPEFLGGSREKAERHAEDFRNLDTVWAARAESILLPNDTRRLEYWIDFQSSFRDDPDVFYELGRAYLVNGDNGNGEKYFRKAMELDSARNILLLDLARYSLTKAKETPGSLNKHLEAAEAYILEYLEKDPIQPVKAWCYARLAGIKQTGGKQEEAEKLFTEAQKLDPLYLKEERLPPMLLFAPPGELADEYYSYFETY